MASGEIHRCGGSNSWNYEMNPEISKPPTNLKVIPTTKINRTWIFLKDFLVHTKSTNDLKTQASIHDKWKQPNPLDERYYGMHRKKTDPLITETRAEAYKEIYKELSIEKTDAFLEIGCGPPLNDKSWYSLGLHGYKIYYSDCKFFDNDQRPFFMIDLDDTDSFKKLPIKMKALMALNVFTCQTSSTLVKWFENAKSLLDKNGLVIVVTDTVPFFSSAVASLLEEKPDSLVFPYITSDHLLHISKSQLVKARDQFQIDSQEYKFLDYLRIQSEELSQQEKEQFAFLIYSHEYATEVIRMTQEVLQALMPNEKLEVNMHDRYQRIISEAFQKANYKVKIKKECMIQKKYPRPKQSRDDFLRPSSVHRQINSINMSPWRTWTEEGPIVNYKFWVIAAEVNSD